MQAGKWINEEMRQLVGLGRIYPYELVPDLQAPDGSPAGGLALLQDERVLITDRLRSRGAALSVYLHEVGHLVAHRAQIDHSPDGMSHNQYFAALVAMMYRRAGLLDRLSIYDFGDRTFYQNGQRSTEPDKEEEGAVDGAELVARFSYILERSKFLAESNMSVESAARWIYREDVFPAWTGRPWHAPKRSVWRAWWPLAAGAAVGLVSAMAIVRF